MIKRNYNLPFIITQDLETKQYLETQGFQIIEAEGNRWTFLNCPEKSQRLNFDQNQKLTFTNKLFV